MKKIMFNDKYGLTQAVLEGRKTMTRRIISNDWLAYHDDKGNVKIEYKKLNGRGNFLAYVGKNDEFPTVLEPAYQIGEEVAVAQAYKSIPTFDDSRFIYITPKHGGWTNKMFVRADLMPHQIRITDIKVERLQDISDEDCLREGVLHSDKYAMPYGITEVTAPNGVFFYYSSPREAFAALIDKVGGKGTWERNPWVFVYEFELVK